MATHKNASTTCPAPITAPTAAKSFTSPAPVAPSTWPGSIIRQPSANPSSDDATVTRLAPVAASVIPAAAVANEIAFGIRRWRTSTTEAVPAPATTAESTNASPLVIATSSQNFTAAIARHRTLSITSPTIARAATTAIAMSDARSPYSSRSWPSFLRANRRRHATVMTGTLLHISVRSSRGGHISFRSGAGVRRLLPNRASVARLCRSAAISDDSRLRRRNLARDRVEDVRDLGTGERDRRDRSDRDERHEQRVLQKVLPVVLAHERGNVVDNTHHDFSLFLVKPPRRDGEHPTRVTPPESWPRSR